MGAPARCYVTNAKGQTPRDRRIEGELILADYNHGMQVSALADKYAISTETVRRRIDEAVRSRVAPNVDTLREAQNALLDDLIARWKQQLDVADVMVDQAMREESAAGLERAFKLREAALNGIARVSERRAKLNGLDAPVKADVTVHTTTPVDDAVAALAAEIAG